MAHLTIYLSSDVEKRARQSAKAAKISVSKWVAECVTQSVRSSWPPEFLSLAGLFPEFPDTKKLRKSYGKDAPRETLG